MVFLSALNLVRSRGPDAFWRKRAVFKLTANFYARRRNCYSIAIRALTKALQHASEGRKQKKKDRAELWSKRISAGAEELQTDFITVMEGLTRSDIEINKKIMSELAVYEPRTFESLVKIGQTKMFYERKRGLNSIEKPPSGIITRGML